MEEKGNGTTISYFTAIFIALFVLFLFPNYAFSHPGNTDTYGCHTCRTNCPSWGLSYGEYHCHQSKGLTQPLDPISSHRSDSGVGYTTPAPNYSYPSVGYPTFSTPSCPLNSSYDSLSGNCKCNSGYVVSKNVLGDESCTSGLSYCIGKYGYGSNYDASTKTCQCDSGYILKNEQCISKSSLCSFNSSYDILSGNCKCNSGYVANSSGQCVSISNFCSGILGPMSTYNSSTQQCECDNGYVLNNGSCISKDNFCNEVLGGHASYNALKESCQCKTGYVIETNILGQQKCIDGNQYCQNKYNNHSKYDSDAKACNCEPGYSFKNDLCIEDTRENNNLPQFSLPPSLPEPSSPVNQNKNVLGANSAKIPDKKFVSPKTNVNVRQANNSRSKILGVAKKGVSYEFILEKNGWIKIKFNGKEGWVSKTYAVIK